MTVIGRRSATSELAPTRTCLCAGTAFAPSARAEDAALSSSIANMILRRWPTTVTPRSLRSSSVSFGSTAPSISLSRNAASYCPRPSFRSHAPTSIRVSSDRPRSMMILWSQSVHGVGPERPPRSETGPVDRVLTLMRRVAKAAAEVVELVEISEGDANVAALAAGMANRDFSSERQGEFVLKRKRVGVDGRGRLSRSARFAGIFAETLDVSHSHAFGDDAVGKRVRLGDREEGARMPR